MFHSHHLLHVVLIFSMAISSTVVAQLVETDTIYTPIDFPEGPLSATIVTSNPVVEGRGVGVILARYTDATRLTARVWCDTLAAHGYLAMTIDYGNIDTSFYPAPQRALKTAVEFLRQNSERYGLYTNKIIGFGQSQGALIWGQTMGWDNDDEFFGTDDRLDDRLDGAVLLYGAYDMYNDLLPIQNTILASHFSLDPSLRGTKGQAITNAGNISTPTLLIHGSRDQVVSVRHSRVFNDSLLAHNKDARLIEIDGAPHVFDLSANGRFTAAGLVAKDAVLAFLERFTSTDIEREDSPVPASYSLGQNYPNPFNPSTQIQFSLPERSFATLKIINVLGRDVSTLVSGELLPGLYNVRWDASGLASGVYLYRLQAATFVDAKKMLLLQ